LGFTAEHAEKNGNEFTAETAENNKNDRQIGENGNDLQTGRKRETPLQLTPLDFSVFRQSSSRFCFSPRFNLYLSAFSVFPNP